MKKFLVEEFVNFEILRILRIVTISEQMLITQAFSRFFYRKYVLLKRHRAFYFPFSSS